MYGINIGLLSFLLLVNVQVLQSAPVIIAKPKLFTTEKVSQLKLHHVDFPISVGSSKVVVYVENIGGVRQSPYVTVSYAYQKYKLDEGDCVKKKIKLYRVQGTPKLLKGVINFKPSEIQREKEIYLRLLLANNTGSYLNTVGLPMFEMRNFVFKFPRQLRVAIMGDSYAAGMGTGQYDIGESDDGRFRSSLSGGELFVTHLKETLDVDYLNTSYFGGQLVGGRPNDIIQIENDLVSPSGQWNELITWLSDEMEGQEGLAGANSDFPVLDYIILTVGGNDIYADAEGVFGLDRLIDALYFNNLDTDEAALERLGDGLNNFELSLRKFVEFVKEKDGLRHVKIVFSNYPDFTKNEKGEYRHPTSLNISKKELRTLYEKAISPLNEIIKRVCREYARNCIINDIENISRYHGYTSDNPWVVRFRRSDLRAKNNRGGRWWRINGQGNGEGEPLAQAAFHPTADGHKYIYYQTLQQRIRLEERYRSVSPVGLPFMEQVPLPSRAYGNNNINYINYENLQESIRVNEVFEVVPPFMEPLPLP